jgi:DNA-binding response OmpR family regulator
LIILGNSFEDCGWQVFTAESGESALELLQNQSCPTAVVDIRMGGMDGETFIRKAYEKHPEIILLFTQVHLNMKYQRYP